MLAVLPVWCFAGRDDAHFLGKTVRPFQLVERESGSGFRRLVSLAR